MFGSLPRILAIRFSSIGDILLTTPLLRALRSRAPDAHLAFLTKQQFAPLLADNPRLDQVITLKSAESLRHLARRLRQDRFTHVLDLHGSLRTRGLRLLVPARWSGYRNHRLAREILIRFKRNVYPRDLPVAERYFDVVKGFGIVPDGGPPEFFLHAKATAEVTAWLNARRVDPGRLIAIAPGAAHNTKRWPVEYWRELLAKLAGRNFSVVVVGGPDDRAIAGEIAAAAEPRAFNAAGEFGLQGTGALLAHSRLVLSGDTGVMHMATAVNTPVIALFGPTVRAFGFFPYNGKAVVLERDLDCRPCTAWGTEICPLGHHRCLRDIVVEDVEAAVLRMVA